MNPKILPYLFLFLLHTFQQVAPISCDAITCLPGYTCLMGTCSEKVDSSCASLICMAGTFCFNGRCVPVPNTVPSCGYRNANVRCGFGRTCVNHRCVPLGKQQQQDPLCTDVFCLPGMICLGGACKLVIDKHSNLPCPHPIEVCMSF